MQNEIGNILNEKKILVSSASNSFFFHYLTGFNEIHLLPNKSRVRIELISEVSHTKLTGPKG